MGVNKFSDKWLNDKDGENIWDVSNNLANVETPGFKRRDLPKSFSVELRRAVDRKDFRRVKGLLPRSAEDRQA